MTSAAHPVAPSAHEFPDWPHGWYVAARSDEFTRAPLSLELFGRRLVGFRTRDGRAVVMDARCWHLGANLAMGKVCDDQIVCAFHGWRYDVDGACALIPAQRDIPREARQPTYAVAEQASRVFVFPGASASYPLPFFDATNPDELIAAPPFAFRLNCPWWLIGTNGFDLQHFAAAHDRKLVSEPVISAPHPAARRIVATFEVCGANWRDRLTRRLAGRVVTMATTMWSGTLAFVTAQFHNGDGAARTTSYGMTEIRPLAASQAMARITIFRQRRNWHALDQLDVNIKRHFIRAFLKPDTQLLNETHYRPAHLIEADRQMIDYLRWLVSASRGEPNPQQKEPQ